ncbi:MAG: chemotaxis protein CheW [Myxococcota bacterium]|nr:chemotaxis protein CheW [Myxococcota bacterium]
MSQYVTFRLKEQLMGIDILLIREINQLMESTFVQRAPEYIIGLINLRGQIVTIFDLATRFALSPCTLSEDSHNIILKSDIELSAVQKRENREDLKTSEDTVGLRVDSVGEVVEFQEDQIEPVPANIDHLDERFISGVVPLQDELLILLNVGALLQIEA